MTDADPRSYAFRYMLAALRSWYRCEGPSRTAVPHREIALMRALGFTATALVIAHGATTSPRPSLHGTGLAVLFALVGFGLFVGGGVALVSMRRRVSEPLMFALVMAMTAATSVGAVAQPNGSWTAGPYFIAIVAALRFGRVSGAVTLALADAAMLVVAATHGALGAGLSLLALGALPWFLILRLLLHVRAQHEALEISSVAEARAAAVAERARVARELHDVLAHSLSALALHLESTRLLAHEQGVGRDLARALDTAHHLAAGGLDEARRAVAAARGEEVPGPEGLASLVDGFREQAALPVSLEVSGEPHALAPEARLAVYRTAQEALTNVRRHAVADRIDVRLDYRGDATVLVVEDSAASPAPRLAAADRVEGGGFGLLGMRERAELLGGSLLATPTAHGFRVELRIPSGEGQPVGR
jgi:signal transduction histidine kinase